VSIPDVIPSNNITWFQAAAACRNSGKELLPNGVWQSAAFGTPDPGDAGDGVTTCNTVTAGPVPTGSTGDCVSDIGAHDLVGNVWEWVENWIQNNQDVDDTSFTSPEFGSDAVAQVDDAFDRSIGFPTALLRGGDFSQAIGTGVFALLATDGPASASRFFGFRCGRPK
jgi:formylglycine-generating enzyme required for sulfatase activity